ncbi:G5 domain-containing protein [Actinoplanes awajinensis]|uniref:G5 domain-containing protein n=1 Tax=Actinoplanes awajinensis TaxID=135946 RepID=UPI000831EB06|nr:G5 domain-containing protein [Actinoplanes awajinensis]
MVASAGAVAVLVGGGVAGAITLTTDDAHVATAEQAMAADPGAAHLMDDPEIVSREAAAAEPLPQRGAHVPVQPQPPAVDDMAGTAASPGATASASAGTAGTAAETGAELRRVRAEDPADRTGPREPRTPATRAPDERKKPKAAATSPAKAGPVITTRTDVETRALPFRTRLVRDDLLPYGFRKVQSPGTPGEETTRYLVTLVDGKPSDRRLLDTTVTRRPEPRVVVFGVQDEECALNLCVPLGRAACPDARTAPDAPAPVRPAPVAGTGPLTVTAEDLSLFDPETLADVRLEPATVC